MSKYDPDATDWTTEDEIEYLRNFPLRKAAAKFGKRTRISPKEFYRGYLEAARNRQRWGFVDKAVVMGVATGLYYEQAGS